MPKSEYLPKCALLLNRLPIMKCHTLANRHLHEIRVDISSFIFRLISVLAEQFYIPGFMEVCLCKLENFLIIYFFQECVFIITKPSNLSDSMNQHLYFYFAFSVQLEMSYLIIMHQVLNFHDLSSKVVVGG